MKNLITLFFAALLALNVNAQTGNVCDSSITVSDNITCNKIDYNIHLGKYKKWFKFVADSAFTTIGFYLPVNSSNTPRTNFKTVKLLSGTCNSLSLLKSDSLRSGSDSLPFLYSENLVQGVTYYIEVTSYSAGVSWFSMCVAN